MIYNLFNLIIDTVATLLAALLLLRFWMQAVRVRPPFSLGQFIFRLTDWLVLPLRRVMPGWGGLDWSSLLAVILVALLSMAIELGVRSAFNGETWIALSLLTLIHWVVYGFIGLIVIEVIFSWVNPDAPLAPLVRALNEPLMRPLRRLIPPIAGVDLSPIVAFLLLRIILFAADNLLLHLIV
ncbi:MAG: Integral rane protein YggT [Pseudomonadota bacterium]